MWTLGDKELVEQSCNGEAKWIQVSLRTGRPGPHFVLAANSIAGPQNVAEKETENNLEGREVAEEPKSML